MGTSTKVGVGAFGQITSGVSWTSSSLLRLSAMSSYGQSAVGRSDVRQGHRLGATSMTMIIGAAFAVGAVMCFFTKLNVNMLNVD